MFFSDEAWFHLSDSANSQNTRIWSSDSPHSPRTASAFAKTWRVVRDISSSDCRSNFLNREVYADIIFDERYCWFQQDGATCHISNNTIHLLNEFFDQRIVSRGLWPPRSPDLSPPP
ncbi:hypothetical protein AVEN_22089-1 [Araneus ventricosus]|uniref:Tc1-like transposase DDE domain-containing protein n=1 Tax=Araneus ventricosus TaxID=182803 RepID=A0A4Y2PMX7_ARAVE|nr:hypothetical protein AVEN_22089-1 [Araneus ventricosus]